MITDEVRAEIKEIINKILEDFDIYSREDFDESVEQEPDSGLYETLKAGVIEEFELSDGDMDELLEEVLDEMSGGLVLYIEEYWDDYLFDTNSMKFVEYLSKKGKEELPLKEIFADFGLDKLQWSFKASDGLNVCVDDFEAKFPYAIEVVLIIAAILLECKVNGSVELNALWCDEFELDERVRITATTKEHQLMNQALMDFVADSYSYNISDKLEEDELEEWAAMCEKLRVELYGE